MYLKRLLVRHGNTRTAYRQCNYMLWQGYFLLSVTLVVRQQRRCVPALNHAPLLFYSGKYQAVEEQNSQYPAYLYAWTLW
jgi:hypothetical protein